MCYGDSTVADKANMEVIPARVDKTSSTSAVVKAQSAIDDAKATAKAMLEGAIEDLDLVGDLF